MEKSSPKLLMDDPSEMMQPQTGTGKMSMFVVLWIFNTPSCIVGKQRQIREAVRGKGSGKGTRFITRAEVLHSLRVP